MLALALAALRSRRAQSLAFMLLTALVIGGVAGTPYYLLAAANGVVQRDQFNVAPNQSRVVLSQQVDSGGTVGIAPKIDTALASMGELMKDRGFLRITIITTLQPLSSKDSTTRINAAIAYASGVCDHVTVVGACPTAPNETMVSEDDARKLRLEVGDSIPFTGSFVRPIPQFKVVGIYKPIDVKDAVWGGILLAANQPNGSATTGDAAFVTLDTYKHTAPEAYVTQTVLLNVGHLSQLQVHDIDSAIADAQFVGPRSSIGVSSSFGSVVNRINDDVNKLLFTVPVLAVETIFLGWFALFLVVRANASNRRAETGLLRLRGVPRRTQFGQGAAQTVLPALIAAPLGAAAGVLGARALAGPVPADERMIALLIALGAGLVVILGVYIAAVTAARRGRGGPILEMLRDTPPRRRGWRSDAIDVVVFVAAVAAVVQSHQKDAQGGLILVAPALAALAVALVVARLIAPTAARAVPRALRSGSVTGLLTVTHLARRPGIDRIFTLLMVVVSLVANALLGWSVASRAQDARAAQEVGADRVLTINRSTPNQLVAATHKIDPQGRFAMAVTYYHDSATDIMALDSSRLASIYPGNLPGSSRFTGADLARILHPRRVTPVTVSGSTLAVRAEVKAFPKPPDGHPTYLIVALLKQDGALSQVPIGPLTMNQQDYTAPVDGCQPSCAIYGLYLTQVSPQAVNVVLGATTARAGTDVELKSINGTGITQFGTWRGVLAPESVGPLLTEVSDGLDVYLPYETYGGSLVISRIFPMNTPEQLPAVYAGTPPPGTLGGVAVATPFGDEKMPVDYVRQLPTIPRLGRFGSMVDLEYAGVMNGSTDAFATMEVWLSAKAPASVVADLTAAGLNITNDESMSAAVASYRSDSSEAARRYGLLGAALGMALGVIALLLVGAGERKSRASEFASLRVQGITDRTMRRAVLASYTLLAAGAIVIGLLATILGRALTSGALGVFTDNWRVLAPPSSWSLTGWLIVLAAAILPLMVTAAIVGRALRRDVTRRLKVAKQ